MTSAPLTLAQLRYLTQYLVGDPQTSTYSTTMYLDAINFAVKDYAKKTGATYAESTATPDANGFAVIPTSYIRLLRVLYSGSQLVESTFSFESMKDPAWQTTVGTPRRWILWSGAKVKISPIPAVPTSATIGYVEDPTDLVLDADVVDTRIPWAHHEYLKYAAGSWLLNLDGDGQDNQLADSYMAKFNALIGHSDQVLEGKIHTSRNQGSREV